MVRTIKVTGHGEVSLSPDLIRLHFTLISSDKEYGEAIEKAKTDAELLRKVLMQLGFDSNSLKTISFNVVTKYDNVDGLSELAGYECIHHLQIAFDYNLELLGQVLDTISENDITPEIRIEFSLKDLKQANDLAIKEALENAKSTAELIATELGVKLIEVIAVEYGNQPSFTSFQLARFVEAIIPDDLVVGQDVLVTWLIEG